MQSILFRKFQLILGTSLSLIFFGSIFSQSPKKLPEESIRVKSWIEIKEKPNQYTFTGNLINYEEVELSFDYRLSLIKRGSSGVSSTNQTGNVKAQPGMVTQLSYSTLDCSKHDFWEAILLIFHDQEMVAADTIRNNPSIN